MTPPWAVRSPIRAACRPLIRTVGEPSTMTSGGPAQLARSLTRAAGNAPIITFGEPVTIGPPTCGVGLATGQVFRSVMRAAGGIGSSSPYDFTIGTGANAICTHAGAKPPPLALLAAARVCGARGLQRAAARRPTGGRQAAPARRRAAQP